MNRKFTSYPVKDFKGLKTQMLNWSKQFNIFCFLDNHQYNFSESSFECLLGVGAIKILEAKPGTALQQLREFKNDANDWAFGHLAYDLKNEIEDISSKNQDHILFPDLFFFVPEIVLHLNKSELKIGMVDGASSRIFQDILSFPGEITISQQATPEIQARFTKKEYISTVEKLREHISKGDCYEINFCQEFYIEDAAIDPFQMYYKLSQASPNPFSSFYRINDKYLLCASPERFLKKTGDKIISQPIKGTLKRETNITDDNTRKEEFLANEKERSENVMIVDLVRNDLSKVCDEASVLVDELYKVYSFPQVHQMISTITGKIAADADIAGIIFATFPMGSMTGAPKKRVMELIEKYERTRRGLFSGAVGYITPGNDFDFNVVIRSILYNETTKYISIPAGAAITFNSDPEKEYEECLLKVDAMKKVLTISS